jgi:endo-1,4-beta-xylanase
MMRFDRRQILGLGAAAAAATALPCAAAAPVPALDSLNRFARDRGRRFGTCLGTRNGYADPTYRALIASDCGVIVPENELKWGWLKRTPTSMDFEAADRLLAFAESRNLAMRGHNLLWHHPEWMPRWVAGYDFGSRPASAAARMVHDHVATVCRRYGRRIHSYDVVNEAVDNKTGVLRETAISKAMGGAEAVLDLAFRTARENAPRAQLVYNDYMSFEAGNAPHRDGVLRLLGGFRKRGVPVDALGVQSHIGPNSADGGFGTREEGEWRRFVDAVVAMGFGLLITELDVSDRYLPADPVVRDRAVADYARPYLDMMLSYDQLGDVLAWGLSDRYSWLLGRALRADGLPKRPCPYDAALRPKPLRETIAASLRSASQHRG